MTKSVPKKSKSSSKTLDANSEGKDFETAIKELEGIISKMESGKLSLADNLTSFEQGIALTNHCQSLLSNAQQKVEILMQEQEEKFGDFILDEDSDD